MILCFPICHRTLQLAVKTAKYRSVQDTMAARVSHEIESLSRRKKNYSSKRSFSKTENRTRWTMAAFSRIIGKRVLKFEIASKVFKSVKPIH
jgi:hypothetical protein